MLFLLSQNSISRTYFLSSQDYNRRKKDQDSWNPAKISVNKTHLVFISFVNFIQQFIKSFNLIAILLISMLKTTLSFLSIDTWGFNNIIGFNSSKILSINGVGDVNISKKVKNLSKAKKLKKLANFKNLIKTQPMELLKQDFLFFKPE